MNDTDISGLLTTTIAAPFLIGLAVGFFAKKLLKLALFIGGFALVALFVMEFYNISTVNNEHLATATDTVGNAMKTSGGFLKERLTHVTGQGLTAIAGFLIGLKLG